jgi:hypothetical protein
VDGPRRSKTLAALVPRLEELGETALALEVASEIGKNDEWRALALAALAPHLSLQLLEQGIEAALEIEDESRRSQTLAALAARLLELGKKALALETARHCVDDRRRPQALRTISMLVLNLLGWTQRALGVPRNKGRRDEAVATVVARLSQVAEPAQALELAWSIGAGGPRVEEPAVLAPRLTPDLLGRTLELVREIVDEGRRAEVLAALAPRLAELGETALALEAAREIVDERRRSQVLAEVVSRLWELSKPAPTLGAPGIVQKGRRAQARAGQVLRAVGEYVDEQRRPLLQKKNASASSLRGRALQVLREPGDEALALVARFSELGETALALEAARGIGDAERRAKALVALVPRLTADMLGRALELARGIGDEGPRADALAALAPHLAPTDRDIALAQALEAAQGIGDEWRRARAGGVGAAPDGQPARPGASIGAGHRR